MRSLCLLGLCSILAAVSRPASAQQDQVKRDSATFANAQLIPLSNGLNRLRLVAELPGGWILVARRENFNAHSYSTATFGVIAAPQAEGGADWELVPFERGSQLSDAVATSEGADCILTDLRVIREVPNGPLTVIRAVRDLGNSYADTARVRFEIYRIQKNDGGLPGWPLYYFALDHTAVAASRYCDVNQAFARELGLGARGLAPVESG